MNQKSFLRYECRVPDLNCVAKHLQIRLHSEDNVAVDMTTGNQYVISTNQATYKPSDEEIGQAITVLQKIVKRPTGDFWKEGVQAIETDTEYRRPTKVIVATDLATLMTQVGFHPDTARWAILREIASGELLAVCQHAVHKPVPELTKEQRLREHVRQIHRWRNRDNPLLPDSVNVVVEAPAATSYTEVLLVWSKSQKTVGKCGARPKDGRTPAESRKIYEDWISSGRLNVQKFVDQRRKGEKAEEIQLVINRVRRSIKRSQKAKTDK